MLYTSPFRLKETTEPTDPEIPSDVLALYAKDKAGVSALFYKDDALVEHDLSGGLTGTGVANRLAFWTGATTLDDVPRTLTPGSVLFAGSDFLPQEDNSGLFYDDTNNDLIIGRTANPFSSLVGRGLAVVRNSGFAEATVGEFGAGTMTTALRLMKAGGTASAPTATQSGMGGVVGLLGYGATAFSGARALVRFVAGENWTDAAQGAYLTLETTPLGGVTLAERFRVGPSGEWGIGGATYGTSGNLFQSGGSGVAPSWLDHTTDFLSQYVFSAGRSGGQTVIGGLAASETLTLQSTAHATKGKVILGTNAAYDEVNNRIGLGTTFPLATLHLHSSLTPQFLLGTETAIRGRLAIAGSAIGSAYIDIRPNSAINGDTALQYVVANTVTGALFGFFMQANDASAGITNAAVSLNNTSATSHASWLARTGGANAGDPKMDFSVSGVGTWTIGLDNSDSDAFKIDPGATLGAAPALTITVDGNFIIGAPASGKPATGTFGLIFSDGTALATMASNTAGLYADDIAGNVSMHAINENGDIIKLIKTGIYTPTNVDADRSYDADSTTVDELADVLGTLIADLQLTGFLG